MFESSSTPSASVAGLETSLAPPHGEERRTDLGLFTCSISNGTWLCRGRGGMRAMTAPRVRLRISGDGCCRLALILSRKDLCNPATPLASRPRRRRESHRRFFPGSRSASAVSIQLHSAFLSLRQRKSCPEAAALLEQ